MSWWNSVESLSKLLNWIGILAAVLTCATAALKIRYDAVKRYADLEKSKERAQLDKRLQDEAKDAKQKLESAQERVAMLEAAQKPRRIPEDTWPSLLEAAELLKGLRIFVKSVSSDPERAQLATDAAAFFRFGGFETDLDLPVILEYSDVPSGVTIVVLPDLAEAVKPFVEALSETGIKCTLMHGKLAPPGGLVFLVSAKPLM